ncbi:hypothetical protein PCANC_12333 [Puccinia coronata f. sp. avenae]|uniref:Uncharacterized protein n=1 Tax=Puccinia coronata f. sp. avenae TaxID=200324 RepID=A0A2N5V3X9_9BASI|nr:hypothetical protein PCANC_21298 [Puccinia coronata f. sp. avenae]PLW44646.1 hypothetical protein PCANC_12333 [Puccinia coronata f. sp. avenae]PLW44879.1 hypothetical protein PCASD_09158 [Puccinia coronata f. sp. avenae]
MSDGSRHYYRYHVHLRDTITRPPGVDACLHYCEVTSSTDIIREVWYGGLGF